MNEQCPSEETLITAIPEIHEIHVSRLAPEDGWHVMRYKDAELTEKMADSLARMCVEFGPGTHSMWDIKKQTGVDGTTIASLGTRMETIGRLDVLNRPIRALDVQLGSFAVAMRRATPEEIAARQKPVDPAYEARMREVNEADARKIDLLAMDHAIIAVDSDRYYVDLAVPESGLLVRMIEALRANPDHRFTPNSLVGAAWKMMHTNERRALTEEDRIYGAHPAVLKEVASRYINTILPMLGVIRHSGSYAVRYSLADKEISVDISELPPQFNQTIKHVLPYEGLRKPELKGVKPETLALVAPLAEMYARVTSADKNSEMQQHEALDLLHKVMLREGKRALAIVLEAREGSDELSDGLNTIHAYIKRILGESAYVTAHRENIIRGYGTGSERVMQQTGRRNLAAVKWYIGTPEDPEGSVEAN